MNDSTDVLLIGDSRVDVDGLAGDGEFTVSVCKRTDDALPTMQRDAIRIAVVFSHAMEHNGASLLQQLRNAFFQEPVQIIATVDTADDAGNILEYGADDFIVHPFELDELRTRLFASVVRLRYLIRIYGEREFFRNAAKQEEELSSRILDQHLLLKEAFQSIESINQELEEANKHLERIARYDILSGLMNRGSLFAAMDSEIDRATRTSAPLSGIMMDIDNFKSINDRFGHLHGDRVIAEIGRRLTAMLRKYDHAGRYGGEEFFIILPNSFLSQAYAIAERFRAQLADHPVEFSGDTVRITASFGVAQYRVGEARESWIDRCDSYLYAAKHAGRNRVKGDAD